MDICERATQILGPPADVTTQASRHLDDLIKARHSEILWKNVAGIGNVLRHDGGHVAAPGIWLLVHNNPPDLGRASRKGVASAQAHEP
jgi:uncharacterized protein with HEPN domain